MNTSYIFIYIYAAHVKRVRFLTFNVDVKQALDLGPRLHLPLWCLNVVAHCLYLCTCTLAYLLLVSSFWVLFACILILMYLCTCMLVYLLPVCLHSGNRLLLLASDHQGFLILVVSRWCNPLAQRPSIVNQSDEKLGGESLLGFTIGVNVLEGNKLVNVKSRRGA